MKTFKFKSVLFIVLIAFFTSSYVCAEEYEAVKNIKKEYQSNDQTLLEIANKYGNIKINDWYKNQIVIEVKITVKAKNKGFAESKLEFINVNFSEKENVIKAITEISDKINNSTGIFSGKKIEFTIDYFVSVPRNLKMNLYNKYGNIFINEIHGKTNITLKYGDLNANKLLFDNTKPLSKLTLSYGDADIKECNWLTSVVKYSDIKIEKGTALVIVSGYSDIKVENCKTMVTESKYDDYKINKVSNFTTDAKYSDINIQSLDNKLFVEAQYGDIKVESIPSGFKAVQVEGKFVDVKLGIADGASYTIDAIVKYGNVDYPKAANVDRKKGTTSESVKGTIGPDSSPKSSVIINCEYGDINLDL